MGVKGEKEQKIATGSGSFIRSIPGLTAPVFDFVAAKVVPFCEFHRFIFFLIVIEGTRKLCADK